MAAVDRPAGGPRRYAKRLHWACAGLCVAVGVFLAADIASSAGTYGAEAWVGVALSALAIITLAIVYVGCASGRLHLEQHLAGSVTVFHLTVVALVVAVGADVLIPDRDSGGLALLLPWGITYWLHNLPPGDDPQAGDEMGPAGDDPTR